MFISIPKEFFVPVVLGEGFLLNEENNNLELDTNSYRESTKVKAQNLNKKEKIEKTADINASKENVAMKKEDIKKEEAKQKPIYVALNEEKEIQLNCNNSEIFNDIDDEYINNLNSDKDCKDII